MNDRPLSGRDLRAGWKELGERAETIAQPHRVVTPEVAARPSGQIAKTLNETIASRTLDTHLQNSIRELSATGDQAMTEQTAAAPAPTAPPVPAAAPAPSTTTASSPGSHALTIKQMLSTHTQKLDQILQAQAAALQAQLDDQVSTVMNGTEAVISRVKGHTDDFKAILGQFTNDI